MILPPRLARAPRFIALLLAGSATTITVPRTTQAQDTSGPLPPDLATLFELGRLVLDTNGDSVPDLVNATLVLGAAPTATETAAAAEISARLGFQTMAMDLPLARGA